MRDQFEPVAISIGTNIHKHREDVWKKKKDKKKHDGHKNQYQTYKFVNIMNMDSKYLTQCSCYLIAKSPR